MFIPVALPPIILIPGYCFDIASCFRRSMLTKQHWENAVLLNARLEYDINRGAVVRSAGQYPATFTRENVGVECHDSAASNEREPGQPGSTHAVAQVERFKLAGTDETVDPANGRRLQIIRLRIVFEDQDPLAAIIQGGPGQRLVGLIAPPHWIFAFLDHMKDNRVLKLATDCLTE